ncbi:MAG: hypothetical protein GX964_11255, partial [Syntrophomonadaceae bacterium]|nr:hypothetical protein [Syntrophomonadaceae bacterium]
MRRVYSKKLAIILILTFMATMFVSVPMASASATYSVTSVSKVTAGKSQELGSIKVLFHMAELDKTSYLTMRLPSDFKFNPENGHNLQGAMKLEPVDNVNDVFRLVYNGVSADGVEIRIPAVKNALAVAQEVYGINKHAYESFTIQHLADNEIKITIDPGKINRNTSEKQGYFFVDFKNVYVDSGYSGDIDVVIDGQQGTLFSSGKLIVGSAGTGTVELSVDSVKTLTTGIGMIDNIRLKEDRPGAFAKGETIKLRLPEGFKWDKDSV